MRASDPAVSIIIPTFNRARVLARAVESVLVQNYSDFELIVVDDGSTDDTQQVLSRFPQLRTIELSQNRGVSHARNTGIHQARGRRICFLDSDDWWMEGKLKAQVEWMDRHPDVPLCHTEEIWIRNGVRVNPMNKHKKQGGFIFKHCLPLCVISPSSVMMDAKIFNEIGLFDETLPACEDYDLWLRLCARYQVGFLPEPMLVKTGGHEDQLSRKYWGMDRFRVKALEKILEEPTLNMENRERVLNMLVEKYEILKNGCMKRNKRAEAEAYDRALDNHRHALASLHHADEVERVVTIES